VIDRVVVFDAECGFQIGLQQVDERGAALGEEGIKYLIERLDNTVSRHALVAL